ncbi:hypothetical protein POM88_027504 [Heracleum sosnowskyi]|uniref:Uncharacterized protein n=1 Tax=Heracleum sosnowskyi TaxID=360622 RepID=A0AAD8MLJ2_9APIA|nr:hypothetical protein POM88_027504 [Heracleum sosnowskyi]
MDVNGISTHAPDGNDGALPCVAQYVHILLVDHDTTSLMSIAYQFEQQLYKVTTTETAKSALALFQEQRNRYHIVIADICMPDMGISEFVEKLHGQNMTVPIILISEELTNDAAREAFGDGVCYVYSKPPSHRDISKVWLHIPRVTGELPPLSDMTKYIDIEEDGSSTGGSAGNQKQNNLNMKLDNTDRESVKRKKNQIVENPNSSNDADQEEDSHNAKKPRLTWTPYLDDKFLQAINVLGERGARPKTILSLMNEPGLTPRHVASHLQKYRRQRKKSSNLQTIDSPVMAAVLPAATLNSVAQGQTFGTASSAYAAAPDFGHYSFYGVKQDLDTLNYSGNNSVNAITNDGVQVPKGNGGGSKGKAPAQEPEGASGRLSKGLEAPNQKPTGKFETVLCGSGNAGNMDKMKNDNLREGTSGSDQQFDIAMPSDDEINQLMQDAETSELDIWNWFK